jgi:hypothetical protein
MQNTSRNFFEPYQYIFAYLSSGALWSVQHLNLKHMSLDETTTRPTNLSVRNVRSWLTIAFTSLTTTRFDLLIFREVDLWYVHIIYMSSSHTYTHTHSLTHLLTYLLIGTSQEITTTCETDWNEERCDTTARSTNSDDSRRYGRGKRSASKVTLLSCRNVWSQSQKYDHVLRKENMQTSFDWKRIAYAINWY